MPVTCRAKAMLSAAGAAAAAVAARLVEGVGGEGEGEGEAGGGPLAPIVVVATVCGTPTVYVPTPPLVPGSKPVTTVPGSTPSPITGAPTKSRPPDTDVTVSLAPEMVAENERPAELAVVKAGTLCITATV